MSKKKSKVFTLNHFYMHEASKDVCIEVMDILEQNEDRTKLVARYWNLGFTGRPWRIPAADHTISIYTSDLKAWKYIDYDALINPRLKGGCPV